MTEISFELAQPFDAPDASGGIQSDAESFAPASLPLPEGAAAADDGADTLTAEAADSDVGELDTAGDALDDARYAVASAYEPLVEMDQAAGDGTESPDNSASTGNEGSQEHDDLQGGASDLEGTGGGDDDGDRPDTSETDGEGENAVREAIAAAIRERGGPISYAEFTRISLYDTPDSYYVSGENVGSHFGTSPETSHVFGQLMAQPITDHWEQLDRPDDYVVAEYGGGRGYLAYDILDTIGLEQTGLVDVVQYKAVEVSSSLAEAQQARLHRLEGNPDVTVINRSALDTGLPDESVDVIISNELVDNLPAERLVRREGVTYGVYVNINEAGELVEVLGDVPEVVNDPYYTDNIPEGGEIPARPGVADLMREAGRVLRPGGLMITVDYGATQSGLRTLGQTFRTYGPMLESGTGDTELALRHPGQVDITSDVDFSDVGRQGARSGLRALSLEHQKDYLERLGYNTVLPYLSEAQREQAMHLVTLESTEEHPSPAYGAALVLVMQKLYSPPQIPPRPPELVTDEHE